MVENELMQGDLIDDDEDQRGTQTKKAKVPHKTIIICGYSYSKRKKEAKLQKTNPDKELRRQ